MLNRKKFYKILAGVTAVAIIAVLLVVVNAFVGNPISASIATYKINAYVEENYSHLDVEVSKATYNFKTSGYQSYIKSNTSEDTRFAVGLRSGKFTDYYEFEVENKFTTYRRLQEEFNDSVKRIIAEEFSYETDLVIADFSKNDGDFSGLSLDMPLDIHNLPLKSSLTLWTISDEVSYDILEIQLMEIHNLMLKNRILIDTYTIQIAKPYLESEKRYMAGDELYLTDFPAELINDENLEETIKVHQKQIERTREK